MNATIEQVLYRSVVDAEFRALVEANPETFGLEGPSPAAVESEMQQGLATIAMSDIDVQACNSTCSWGLTIVCDKFTN